MLLVVSTRRYLIFHPGGEEDFNKVIRDLSLSRVYKKSKEYDAGKTIWNAILDVNTIVDQLTMHSIMKSTIDTL